jgi:peptide/nickel transport system ATP-binding protein
MASLLEFHHVSRKFAVRRGLLDTRPSRILAVDDVSLSLEAGETLGMVGESGCGKSTLARMVVRLLPVSSGEIVLDGRELSAWRAGELARTIQMIFQDPFSSLDPRQTVGASVGEPLLLASRESGGLSQAVLREAVEAILAKVGLAPEYYARYPHEFSGGQRQRIAVARALISGPRLVVCDEPVSALDASVQSQVLNLLKDVQEERRLTYLFISHDLGVVGFMSDRVAVMYLGRIVEQGKRDALFERAAHPYTAALLAAATARERAGKERPLLSGELPSPLSPPSGCAFHPRCPRTRAECAHNAPPWLELAAGHSVRCHFPLQA